MGFLSSCDGDLRDPIVLPQESQVSVRVVRDLSGFLSSQCRGIGPHLELRLEPQGSSPVLTWISGFLWSFNRGVRLHLVWRHGTLLPSRGVKGLSGFLSIGIGILGFFLRCHGAVTPPFMFFVSSRGSSQVRARESGLSGVDGEIRVFSN